MATFVRACTFCWLSWCLSTVIYTCNLRLCLSEEHENCGFFPIKSDQSVHMKMRKFNLVVSIWPADQKINLAAHWSPKIELKLAFVAVGHLMASLYLFIHLRAGENFRE